jgi:hypothetical protein
MPSARASATPHEEIALRGLWLEFSRAFKHEDPETSLRHYEKFGGGDVSFNLCEDGVRNTSMVISWPDLHQSAIRKLNWYAFDRSCNMRSGCRRVSYRLLRQFPWRSDPGLALELV